MVLPRTDFPGYAVQLQNQINTAATNASNKPKPYPEAWAEFLKMMGLEGASLAASFDETKAEQRELLGKAVGTLEPMMQSPWLDYGRSYLGRHGTSLDVMEQTMQDLLDPSSQLASAQRSTIRTGARNQLGALAENAAQANIPQSQRAGLNVMQQMTDRLLQVPLANRLEAATMANVAGGQALSGLGGAATMFQSQLAPASQIASIYAGTNVTSPLLGPTMSAIQGIGQGAGTYFPSVPGQPWNYLNY